MDGAIFPGFGNRNSRTPLLSSKLQQPLADSGFAGGPAKTDFSSHWRPILLVPETQGISAASPQLLQRLASCLWAVVRLNLISIILVQPEGFGKDLPTCTIFVGNSLSQPQDGAISHRPMAGTPVSGRRDVCVPGCQLWSPGIAKHRGRTGEVPKTRFAAPSPR